MKLDPSFPRFASISERDINILVAEELACAPSFQQQFFRAAGIDIDVQPGGRGVLSWTSICLGGDEAAEIDIVADAAYSVTGDGVVRLLIENKIDTGFQPLQPARYRAQAQAIVASGHAKRCRTVLIAPSGYLRASNGDGELFDARIEYEQMVEWIRREGVDELVPARAEAKTILFEQAIRKQKRSMPAVINPVVTNSWSEIYATATAEFPDLCMPSPGDKGRSAWSVDLPCIERRGALRTCRLEYVLKKGDIIVSPGTVTLLIPRASDRIDQFAKQWGGRLDDDFSIRKAGGSIGITISVPPVDPGKPLAPQRGNLIAGFEAARRLRDWYAKNFEELARFVSA